MLVQQATVQEISSTWTPAVPAPLQLHVSWNQAEDVFTWNPLEVVLAAHR